MSDSSTLKPGGIGIVLNPASARARQSLNRLRALAHAVPDALVWEVSKPADIAVALRGSEGRDLDLLVVVGGDGTLQAVITELNRSARQGLPVLVVPGGTTNMSAAGLGARLGPTKALRALGDWRRGQGRAPARVLQAVLRVEGCVVQNGEPNGGAGSYWGFFFGNGAIESGVRYFHQRVRGRGLHRVLGPAVAFGRILVALLTGRSHPLLVPVRMRILADDRAWEGQWLMVMASTLDRLLLGCRPYWGWGSAPIHFSALADKPRRLLRVLPGLVRGRVDKVAREEDGYVSENLSDLMLECDTGFILDGERFRGDSRIRLSATPPQPFLVY